VHCHHAAAAAAATAAAQSLVVAAADSAAAAAVPLPPPVFPELSDVVPTITDQIVYSQSLQDSWEWHDQHFCRHGVGAAFAHKAT